MKIAKYIPYYKIIFKLAIPVILAQIGIQLVSIVDNIMVGQLGKTELAGVALGGSVFFFFFIFLIGISIGLTPLIGSFFTQKKELEIDRYFQNAFVLYGIIGIIFFLVLFFSKDFVLNHLNQPKEVVEKALPYYNYLVWSIIPYMFFSSFKQLFEGLGNTITNMIIIMVSNVINIFLNWVFIYGNLGFEALGGAGAGLATLISRICLPIFAIIYVLFSKENKKYIFSISKFLLDKKALKQLLYLGLPIALQLFIENFTFVATTIMTGWMNTAELAANQIAITLASFSFMIVLGVNSATTICVSQEFGRENYINIKRYSNAAFHLAILWSIPIAIIFILCRFLIGQIFISDQEVIMIAANLVICVAFFQLSDSVQSISLGILRGLHDVKMLIPISILSYIIIDLPIGYFLAFYCNLNALGIWLSFIFGLSFAAFLYQIRIKKQMKKLYQKIKSKNNLIILEKSN